MEPNEANQKPEENVTYPRPENSAQGNQEPVTQVQRDSVITREDVPSPKFRVGLTVLFMTIFAIIAAVYYGTFTP